MKFTLFALLVAVCVFSTNAGTWQPVNMSPDVGTQFEIEEFDNLDTEADFFLFSGVYYAIKVALRSVKGFNCLIKWVVGIKTSALQYSSDIIACGVTANQDVTNLINANLKIITTANNIINLKSNICAGADESKPVTKCVVKTLYQVFQLYKQVKSAIKLAKKIPTTGPNAVQCVTDATTTLTNYYTQFPSNIKSCSKLTS
ncbi:uncharacterized protein LOC133847871 [Drosophila sulfurigaster albostrigata]|uniref:uncharacterized protein LOC133847871 n=1 Tax=Drosophila sulfurigaster albostrigata TaxID=89887 RepID=UPI002D218D12|nr:uncharacterized protein LOC133847871 [Drosophila sulfurigaster albostrigata]